MSLEGKPPRLNKFILRTFEMVSNAKHSNIVAWTESGTSFSISSIILFTSKVLPLYFKHKNFSSFVRQLNMYGFHKERDTGDIQVYTHPCFVKGQREKLDQIQRKINDSETECVKNVKSDKKLVLMNCKQKLLQEKISNLENNYKEVVQLNQCLLFQVSQCMEREQKLQELLNTLIRQTSSVPDVMRNHYLNLVRNINSVADIPQFFNEFTIFSQNNNQ